MTICHIKKLHHLSQKLKIRFSVAVTGYKLEFRHNDR